MGNLAIDEPIEFIQSIVTNVTLLRRIGMASHSRMKYASSEKQIYQVRDLDLKSMM